MRDKTLKKGLVLTIILLIISMSMVPSSGTQIDVTASKTIINDGTLSGYVNDTSGNPVDGALMRVHFHETYEETYSDEVGYYYVDNIPICYCLKNTTCSKDGYKSEWILLGIYENTTHDFVLTFINDPPDKPTITGPTSGKAGEEYCWTFHSITSFGEYVYYYINWGDGTNTGWIGPYSSCTPVEVCHIYEEQGTYTIKAKAKDKNELESEWAELSVSMPKNKPYINTPFLNFLQNHPLIYQLLQRLLKL